MPQKAITKTFVDEVSAAPKDTFYWDTREKGFGLKVTAGGSKSYVYQYRLGGRESPTRRYTIGRHGQLTPDLARKRAKELMLLVNANVDPATADRQQRRERVELAFSAYADRFTDEYLKSQWIGGGHNAAGYLRRNAVPHFGRQALPEIKRADISSMLSKIDSVASRRNTFAVLRRLFKWAVGRGDIEASPMRDMEVPPSPEHRERTLQDRELALVWRAAGELGYPFGSMFRLLILTGQRRSEVSGLKWEELDQAKQVWTLPTSRSKNKKAHRVPLTESVVSILDELTLALTGDTKGKVSPVWPRKGLIFTITGKTPVSGYSKAKQRLDREAALLAAKLSEAAPEQGWEAPADWRLHDLRRTVATGMQRVGVRLEVTEACLNHVSGSRAGIVRVYQTHDYDKEKREALVVWAEEMARIAALLPAQA